MPIQHVWFDFNDTLVVADKDEFELQVPKRTDIPPSDVHQRRELKDVQYQHPTHQLSDTNTPVFGVGQDPWLERLKKAAKQGYFRLLDPDTPAVLNELSKIVPISIFADLDAELILQGLGLDRSIFTHILDRSDTNHAKPHPDAYWRVVQASNVSVTDILYVGHDEQTDIEPVKLLGMKAGVLWATSSKADYNFTKLQDVLDLIKQQ